MPIDKTGNHNNEKESFISKGKSNSTQGSDTKFLYGFLQTKSSGETKAQGHEQKMMEGSKKLKDKSSWSLDEAKYSGSHPAFFEYRNVKNMQRSKSDSLNIKIKDELSGITKEDNKKELRKFSSFDEAKYSGSHPAFFDARKVNEKSQSIREISKEKTKSDIGGIGKEDNGKEKSTEASPDQKRKVAAFDEAMNAGIPYGIAAASNELNENWRWSVRIKRPGKK